MKRLLRKVLRNKCMYRRLLHCTVIVVLVIVIYKQNSEAFTLNDARIIKWLPESSLATRAQNVTAENRSIHSNTYTTISTKERDAHEILTTEQPWCPDPPKVDAKNASFAINLNETTYFQLVEKFGHLMQDGGHYVPPTCRSREHVALIIPYRDRQRNLYILLSNLLPFLMRQQLEFTVFLSEQTSNYTFNKGLLFNVAYKQSQKIANFTCFIMQDTDLIPMDNRNFYRCGDQPRHLVLTTGQTKWRNRLRYKTSFGGAIALRKRHMEAVNGFSVLYYGWGFEDDDLYFRLKKKKFTVVRYPILIGKYYEMRHKKQSMNPEIPKMKKTLNQRLNNDGLIGMNFTLVHQEKEELYTWLLVQVPPPPLSIYGKKTGTKGDGHKKANVKNTPLKLVPKMKGH
ncbi:beta-1,4-galactosyltransferase 4-like [Littorina saxatilis]|uniref:beta-1,4-galactosyltransferase 4-like n=1 Tax=Littorina saxatilis TaxID=31220 RepID=UPI0038B5E875